ncbi:MAG: SDR family NAD(P)-dependent oxidoreductase [Oligoflexia bacterium]|nr:SDR family NAD(P)-dependent oxidoreductase [Oligoflexia bacterium]
MNETKKNKRIAIITGASAGLGSEFAKQIENRFFLDEVWLVARRMAPMQEISERFMKAKGILLSLDLTNEGDLLKLKQKIEVESPDIQILVNNAGFGKIGAFSEISLEEQLQMIDLNIRSLTFISHICEKYMNKGSAIIQVASSIGFCPSPYFTVYAATKAYVVSFSDALGYELKNKGIHVMAVCPGPVKTEFFNVAQGTKASGSTIDDEPFNDRLSATADAVVEQALNDLIHKKRYSIYSMIIKIFAYFIPFVPRALAMKILALRK